jgi:hypothetical protein
MSCRDKVPWLDGEPKDICKLDDKEQLKKHNIILDNSLKKGDYYVQRKDGSWVLVERKDGDSDIRKAIDQLKSTLNQLRTQNKVVSQLIVVFDKISKTESRLYQRNRQSKHLVNLSTPSKRQINIENMPLELYYSYEVNEMRQTERLQ